MIDERKYVIENFEKYFQRFKGKPIVIYGLGKNTEAVLQELTEFNVIGLMDGVRTGETVFGKKVITCEEAASLGVQAIIIIARASNVPIIYRRIANFCIENEIEVYDIAGNKKEQNTDVWSGLDISYQQISEEKLLREIDVAEVVSFDIFDTLLVRTVLYPHDVFLKMEEILQKEDAMRFCGFAGKRISAEQKLYATKQPMLREIYNELQKEFYATDEEIKKWMELEIRLEDEVLIARSKMQEIFFYALKKGKNVCLTSDMYLPELEIRKILVNRGFELERVKVLVSCEYGVAKYNGLYSILLNLFKNQKILHIGDNEEADGTFALDAGVDRVFLIRSVEKMLEDSIASELFQEANTLEERTLIARFAVKQFNNPFVFEKTKGKLLIDSEYDIGYSFLAPITRVFVGWMRKQIEEKQIDCLLLASRDGYLIEKLLCELEETEKNNFKHLYFYASRSACILAGLRNKDDIVYAASLAFDGTAREMLKTRFRLQDNMILVQEPNENELNFILRHETLILKNAEEMRRRYLLYINKLGLNNDDKYGFFDFVSSGTCQMSLQQFLKWNMTGLYFARIYDVHKENLTIESLCPETCVYENQKALLSRYFFLENVFTSFEPTLDGFDADGNPYFAKEYRTKKQMQSLRQIQQGILDGIKEQVNDGRLVTINFDLADKFLKYTGSAYSMLNVDYFEENPLLDEFCNRKFEIKEE